MKKPGLWQVKLAHKITHGEHFRHIQAQNSADAVEKALAPTQGMAVVLYDAESPLRLRDLTAEEIELAKLEEPARPVPAARVRVR